MAGRGDFTHTRAYTHAHTWGGVTEWWRRRRRRGRVEDPADGGELSGG